jgi:hypothetical protein
LLTGLADRCVSLLGVSAAGVMLASPAGSLGLVASSSEAMRLLELFELQRGAPCQLRDTDGTPVTPEQARQIIAANWTVPEDVRKRRRSRKTTGRTPQQAKKPVQRGDPPRPGSRPGHTPVNPAP